MFDHGFGALIGEACNIRSRVSADPPLSIIFTTFRIIRAFRYISSVSS